MNLGVIRQRIQSALTAAGSALTKHPSPEDAASVVSSTAVGAFVTGLNALIYAIGAFEPAAIPFLALWLGVILMLCLTMTRMSR